MPGSTFCSAISPRSSSASAAISCGDIVASFSAGTEVVAAAAGTFLGAGASDAKDPSRLASTTTPTIASTPPTVAKALIRSDDMRGRCPPPVSSSGMPVT